MMRIKSILQISLAPKVVEALFGCTSKHGQTLAKLSVKNTKRCITDIYNPRQTAISKT